VAEAALSSLGVEKEHDKPADADSSADSTRAMSRADELDAEAGVMAGSVSTPESLFPFGESVGGRCVESLMNETALLLALSEHVGWWSVAIAAIAARRQCL
jgi:hypothetical protein